MKILTISVTVILIQGLTRLYGGTVETVRKEGLMIGEGRSGGWYAVNDDVMGGISRGGATLTDHQTLRFSGDLSLENNGGFSSIRNVARPFGIGSGDGIRLSVKGDGKTYQLRVQTSNWYDGIAYKAEFTTVEGKWQEFEIPWSAFSATFRGQSVPDAPVLDSNEIRQVGFLIAGAQAGPFALEIAAITPF